MRPENFAERWMDQAAKKLPPLKKDANPTERLARLTEFIAAKRAWGEEHMEHPQDVEAHLNDLLELSDQDFLSEYQSVMAMGVRRPLEKYKREQGQL